MDIKQSILVVTYNHEKYIEQCLNSIINQTQLPYEIIVSDDCSIDNTWNIVKKYKKKYPKLFRIFRNKKNIGVFDNIDKIRGYYSGNVINFCAGDDLFKPKTIEKISNAILKNNLNPETEFFIIILNSIHLYPDGKEWIWDNYKYRDFSLMRLKLRFGISFRSTGYSKQIMDKSITEKKVLEIYPNLNLGCDSIKGFEELKSAEKTIFVNYAGPVYRLGAGLTSNVTDSYSLNSQLKLNKIIKKRYKQYWNKQDLRYIDYSTYYCSYKLKPTVKLFLKTLYYSLININNFTSNYPWIRSLNFLLPEKFYMVFKYKIYPLIRNFKN